MKKLLSVTVAAVLVFTACQQPAASHSHSYGDWETVKEPTCTEKGQKKRTCACGEEETEEIAIDPDAHSFEDGWKSGRGYHWHKANCGHDTKSNYGPHRDEDNNYECDICKGDKFPADWVEPEYEFDPSGNNFEPVAGSVRYSINHKGITTGTKVPVIIPKIKIDSETGKKIISFNDIKNDGWEWRKLDTDSNYIEFHDHNIGSDTDKAYILYDDLKSICDNEHIKMTDVRFTMLCLKFATYQ